MNSGDFDISGALMGLKNSSPAKIRINNVISTKKNYGTEGKMGRFKGKTANNMYILEVDGKTYNFFKKDLDVSDQPKTTVRRTSPKKTSPKRTSPTDIEAESIARNFLSGLDSRISGKVIDSICKRRTSRAKSPRALKSPTRKSPAKGRSRKACRDDEEISVKNGRCIKRCSADQIRDPTTNRCRKSGTRTRSKPVIKPKSPLRPIFKTPPIHTIPMDEEGLIIEDSRKSPHRLLSPPKDDIGFQFEEPSERRVTLRETPSPRIEDTMTTDFEFDEPKTQNVSYDDDDDDDDDLLIE
jgi:hypothetical protein